MDTGKETSSHHVNLEEATKLVAALEQDLQQLSGDSRDLQRLKDEVQTLKNVLNSPVQRHHWVRDGLHGVREAVENALDTALAEGLKGSRYIAEIGRILGM
jgi:DNA repair ATPase RecN